LKSTGRRIALPVLSSLSAHFASHKKP
jgi:hypothetical protein